MRGIAVLFTTLLMVVAIAAQTRDKVRVFIEESQSWEVEGSVGGVNEGFGGSMRGGARPQTAEIIKTFSERCPQFIVTSKKDRADYVVVLQHEGGKDLVRRDNKFAVFNRDGDSVKSGSTRMLGNAVKNACDAITKDLQTASNEDK